MARYCRKPPASIELQLRQEANFGCVMCGNPILENAHIIPWNLTHSFPPEDMVALCPNCHTKADLGHLPEYVLRDAKQNPHNKIKVQEEFSVTGKDLVVNLGSFKTINISRVLVVYNFDIITIRKNHGNYLSLDVNLFDKFGRFVAVIYDNKWVADTRYFWDVEYKPQHLTIRSKPRHIEFDVKIKDEEVFITGNMYYRNVPIIVTKAMTSILKNHFSNVK